MMKEKETERENYRKGLRIYVENEILSDEAKSVRMSRQIKDNARG